jgi:hypothetical protein
MDEGLWSRSDEGLVSTLMEWMGRWRAYNTHQRRSYFAKVKPTDQTGMEREGNIITIIRGAVI